MNFLLALLAGICTPTQTAINNKLRQKTGSPYITSLISFTVAWICLTITLLIVEHAISIPFATINEHPFWIWLGGVFGVLIVVPTTIAVPKIGAAKMTMLLSFGQIMSSLIIDHFGLFDSLQIKFGLSRAIGSVVVIAGVALLSGFIGKAGPTQAKAGPVAAETDVSGDSSSCPDTPKQSGTFFYSLGAVVAGIACSLQVAVNGTLTGVVGSPVKSAFISMTVGTIANAILVLVMLIFMKKTLFDKERVEIELKPWMLLGGTLAFILVGSNAVAAPVIGTGLVTIMNLVGQMGMGLVIDAVGFLGLEKQAVTKSKIIGMIAMVVGVIIITFI